jgi:hypothetical protein
MYRFHKDEPMGGTDPDPEPRAPRQEQRVCQFSKANVDCNIKPTKENCREHLLIEVDLANGGNGVCTVCGADRMVYLKMMHEPCWHGHGLNKSAGLVRG